MRPRRPPAEAPSGSVTPLGHGVGRELPPGSATLPGHRPGCDRLLDSHRPPRGTLEPLPVPSEEDGAGHWSLDHLFFDRDAIPTFFEIGPPSLNQEDGEMPIDVAGAGSSSLNHPVRRFKEAALG